MPTTTILSEDLKWLKEKQKKVRERLCSGKNGAELRKLYEQIDAVTALFLEGKLTFEESTEQEDKLYDEIQRLLELQ